MLVYIQSFISQVYIQLTIGWNLPFRPGSTNWTNFDYTTTSDGGRNRWGLTKLIFGPLMNWLGSRGYTPFWYLLILLIIVGILLSIYFSISYKKNFFYILVKFFISPGMLVILTCVAGFCFWSQYIMDTTGSPLPTLNK